MTIDDSVGARTLLGDATEFFMGEMHRISRLECHHLMPFAISNFFTNLHGSAERVGKLFAEIAEVQYLDLSRDAVTAETARQCGTCQ
jgi:hypothetical protein